MRREIRWQWGSVLVALLITGVGFSPAVADTSNCPHSICISVSTNPATGKITILGKEQISGSKKILTPTQKPAPKPIAKPIAKPTPKPIPKHEPPRKVVPPRAPIRKPQPPSRYVPSKQAPYRKKQNPVVKKARIQTHPAVHKVVQVTKGVSLSDQISQLLPGGAIFTTPSAYPLTHEPLTVWSQSPQSFTTLSQVLGVPVQLFLTPTFDWDFGDGTHSTTHDPGAPYPNGEITHTYEHAGNYLITLHISWFGSWVANNISTLLPGALTQSFQYPLTVITAPTRYLG